MSIAVLVRAHIRLDRFSDLIATLQERVERDASRYVGRHSERIFRRLGADRELLSLSQWESRVAVDAASTTLSPEVVGDAALEPVETVRLTRLLSFERPLLRSDVMACAVIVPTRGDSPVVHERVVQDRRELRSAPGLISHEIYVTATHPVMYLSIHSWRQLADLQRFRDETGTLNERRLAEVGATLERFTGELVAEYPLAVGTR